MEAAKHQPDPNDYAVAKVLNDLVRRMVWKIVVADALDFDEDFKIKELNRAYILLSHELEKLYAHNSELDSITPRPLWKDFEVLETSSWYLVNEYLENSENDMGEAHIARIERLCIISGKEVPDLSPEQEELIDYVEKALRDYDHAVAYGYIERQEKNWQIPEYTLTFKFDGTILVNDVLKLKKVHASSTTERLLDQAIKNSNKLFKPDIGQTSRNISTVLSGAGFTEELRALFFPIASKSRGVFFRPTVTRKQADEDNIDTSKLDHKLNELGAKTEPKST